jgi:hypothetical protein
MKMQKIFRGDKFRGRTVVNFPLPKKGIVCGRLTASRSHFRVGFIRYTEAVCSTLAERKKGVGHAWLRNVPITNLTSGRLKSYDCFRREVAIRNLRKKSKAVREVK